MSAKKIRRFLSVILSIILTAALFGCKAPKSPAEPTLKDYYADYFPVGAALTNGAAVLYEDLLPHFNSLTCENDMKWEALQPSAGAFSWSYASTDNAGRLVDLAKANGMRIRGHALVWYRAMPSWVLPNGTTKERALERLRAHINAVVKHFGSDVYCWDVVNEAIKDSPSASQVASGDIYRAGGEVSGASTADWYAVCGKDYIKEAFIAAKAAVDEIGADIKLYYNDYGLNSASKRNAVIKMITELKSEGVTVDGVGMQAHYNVSGFKISDFENSVKAFTDMGLDVQVTEMDVSIYPWGAESVRYEALPEDIELIQAEVYGSVFEVLRNYSAVGSDGKGHVTGATFWGVADDVTWLDDDPVRGRKNWPLIFDGEYSPKKAYYSIIDF
ncbi:MAG: endo-1,4-beta-xylanase [Clostridiales bacterium]|jgi:endo-1,4-beta-xylanase|nr:endo-1,4-beta-xylanase [Clostridiales bacterium]